MLCLSRLICNINFWYGPLPTRIYPLLSEEEGIDFREGVLHAGYFRTNNQFAVVINNRKGMDNSSKSKTIKLAVLKIMWRNVYAVVRSCKIRRKMCAMCRLRKSGQGKFNFDEDLNNMHTYHMKFSCIHSHH